MSLRRDQIIRCGLILSLLGIVEPRAQNTGTVSPPANTNRVLELDGKGSYVELPPNPHERLDEISSVAKAGVLPGLRSAC